MTLSASIRLCYVADLYCVHKRVLAPDGVHFFTNPQLSLLDLGGQFRISILDELNANILLQLVYQQPFDGIKTKGGLGADIGIELPVYAW